MCFRWGWWRDGRGGDLENALVLQCFKKGAASGLWAVCISYLIHRRWRKVLSSGSREGINK